MNSNGVVGMEKRTQEHSAKLAYAKVDGKASSNDDTDHAATYQPVYN